MLILTALMLSSALHLSEVFFMLGTQQTFQGFSTSTMNQEVYPKTLKLGGRLFVSRWRTEIGLSFPMSR